MSADCLAREGAAHTTAWSPSVPDPMVLVLMPVLALVLLVLLEAVAGEDEVEE